VDEAVFIADRVFILSARPGRLLGEVNVKFPRPRDVLLFRDSAFNDMTAEIEQQLVVDDYVGDR
jgi:sulfonate transport system ATP-binding protein